MREYLRLICNVGDMLYFIALAVILVIVGYYFVISIFGWRKRTDKYGYKGPANSYAIIISAHNEQAVIENTIKSIREMDYPLDKYEIFVIADNCSDNTAQKARESGASVYERTNLKENGKGQALKWMFNILAHLDRKYDAVVILDADNLVSEDFLKQIDKKMSQGYEVVQGYRDMKNPWESWITLSYSITYWLANRLCQLPRQYLGINCTLTGSGYAVSMSTLNKIGWNVDTLTEDVEFYFQLCLQNVKIGWAHEAVIYDEQPTTLSQSWRQRTRWMQGHFSCMFLYGKRVLKRFLEEKSLQSFDSLIMLLYPLFYVLAFMLMAVRGIGMIVSQIGSISLHAIIAAILVSLFSTLLQNIYSLFFLANEKKANKKVILGLILLPVFNFTWVPIMIQGYFSRKSKKWAHIAHSGSMTL
ncbi:MAG TPA: glycosyltransferase family 2 protein [Ruminiclostridium sp.]|nr:glycosyltransferase family 2 protein [Ruminiclostridium sp.]